jgi:hypothetical protein
MPQRLAARVKLHSFTTREDLFHVHDFHLADPKRLAPDRVKTLAAQPINALPFSVGIQQWSSPSRDLPKEPW